jgi:hypothetical protein
VVKTVVEELPAPLREWAAWSLLLALLWRGGREDEVGVWRGRELRRALGCGDGVGDAGIVVVGARLGGRYGVVVVLVGVGWRRR